MAKALVLKGHGLRFEGRVNGFYGLGSGPGRARCACGWTSEPLATTAARQRAHRAHKQAIRPQQGSDT